MVLLNPDWGDVVEWSVDWGDGGPLTTDTIDDGWIAAITDNEDGTWTITHTYADDGEYEVEITVVDDHEASRTTTSMVAVEDVAPAMSLDRRSSYYDGEESFYEITLTATDPGDDPIVAWTITWGDEGMRRP